MQWTQHSFPECNTHPLNFPMIPGNINILVKVIGSEGESSGQVEHPTLRKRERTELINQPSTSAKRQVAAEEVVFHNAVWVSMISPCVWHERPYQLSQQILSRLQLISDRPQRVGAYDTGRVNAECLNPPFSFLKDHENSAEFREGSEWFRFRGSVWLFLRKIMWVCVQYVPPSELRANWTKGA